MICTRCEDCYWVCEVHDTLPWQGANACPCGAAGAPCPSCNGTVDGEAPKMPEGFKMDIDRH